MQGQLGTQKHNCQGPTALHMLLQIVKIYVSIYSDERGKQKAMERLKRLEP